MGQNTETYFFKVSSREKFSIYNLLTQPNTRKGKSGETGRVSYRALAGKRVSRESAFFCGRLNLEIAKLAVRSIAWTVGHEVLSLLRFGKGNHIANTFLTSQYGD